jgi:hypothetical protein
MTEHLAAGYEGTPSRPGEQNGYSTRDLITPAGRIAQLRVPRDREGTFPAELFARYKRTRVVGIFPGEGSLVNLATVVMLRATAAFPSGKHGEDWAFRRYLDMGPLWAAEEKPPKIAT